tara:strand:+ start:15939 stop:18092 length:2154 start_codon:yes stop_codon:yes gene_type:complete
VERGLRVQIPFAGQTLIGCVLQVFFNSPEGSADDNLVAADANLPKNIDYKEIEDVFETFSFITKEDLELLYQISRYYLISPGEVVNLFLPRYQPRASKRYSFAKDLTSCLDLIPRNRKKLRQGLIRFAMGEAFSLNRDEVLDKTSWGVGLFRDALKMGLLEEINCWPELKTYDDTEFSLNRVKWPKLSAQQKKAYEGIRTGANTVQYLQGVTGSGKTEVYLNLVYDCLKRNQNVIFLVPEIALTPQFVNIFKQRFGELVAVFHSKISDRQKYLEWKQLLEGSKRVVIGARSALFSPVPRLGLIILDEEGESSYKQDTSPFYDARRVAEKKARITKSRLIMGSATPSLNSWRRIQSGEISCQTMQQRHNQFELPRISIVDLKNEFKSGNFSVFSRELKEKMHKEIDKGNQIILFVNRRGHSSFVMCRQCSHTLICPRCELSLTYHDSDVLHCHYCGFFIPKPPECPKCQSKAIKQFGLGTQKVESFFKKEFPGVSVARLDTDLSSKKGYLESVLDRMRNGDIKVLIGTQMISKGLDFENITLVGIMNPDSLVKMGDFSARERAFQLFVQIAGRCGRSSKRGEVVLQTYTPDLKLYEQLCQYELDRFVEQELTLREALQFPPYSRLVYIESNSEIQDKALKNLQRVHQMLLKIPTDLIREVYEPQACPIPKINNRYRFRCVVKATDSPKLWEELETVRKNYRSMNHTRTKFLVDPENLL